MLAGFSLEIKLIQFADHSQAAVGARVRIVLRPSGLHVNTLEYASRVLRSVCGCQARCSSVVRAFAHCAMGCRINPLW